MRPAATVLCSLLILAPAGFAQTYRIAETSTIDTVPSWFPVGFCLLTHGQRQYVADYDAEHRMIVATRSLGDEDWHKAVLPSEVGWDSHNYVTLAVDSRGELHLSGNMHADPLVYYRTSKAGDIESFERKEMTGKEGERCTYPRFLRDADGTLPFTYRDGGSGKGRWFYNAYDPDSRSWSRFLDTPLFDGEGERNAYPQEIVAWAQENPNVLWLTVEDMSPWIASYGDDTVPTPNLDRLAGQSVRYANAFATSPVCAPARSSLITGMFATRIGTMQMRTGSPSKVALERNPDAYASIPSYEGVPPEFVRCFPELLRAAGYYCTNAAKTDYQFRAPATVWDASGGKAHWNDRAPGQPFFAVFNHGGTHESQAFPDRKRKPSVVAPADVSIPPLYPDTPAVRDALARTYDNIAAMDAWVGDRLRELEEAGLAESTVVFFFSDHGVGLPRGKRSPYDLGTRVPLLVRFPGGERAGTTEERVVSFVDFGPSVLSLAGIEPDARLDGVPFLGPHARAGSGFAFAHADRFDSEYDRARSVTDGRFRYVRNLVTDRPHVIPVAYRELLPMTLDLYALRDTGIQRSEQWQVASRTRPAEELYDSEADPWEVHDLSGDEAHAETLGRLRAALDAWIEDTGDLGLVLPERRMVEEHLWHGETKPETAPATRTIGDEGIELTCATAGASIGYRLSADAVWTVYTGPIPPGDGSGALEVLTHRIGFEPAQRTFEY